MEIWIFGDLNVPGLAELCSCWTNCVNQGHSEAIWANARRRISLVFPSHALPSEMPDRTEVVSLPLRPGGAENCNITFFKDRGVKNVILQYWTLTRKK